MFCLKAMLSWLPSLRVRVSRKPTPPPHPLLLGGPVELEAQPEGHHPADDGLEARLHHHRRLFGAIEVGQYIGIEGEELAGEGHPTARLPGQTRVVGGDEVVPHYPDVEGGCGGEEQARIEGKGANLLVFFLGSFAVDVHVVQPDAHAEHLLDEGVREGQAGVVAVVDGLVAVGELVRIGQPHRESGLGLGVDYVETTRIVARSRPHVGRLRAVEVGTRHARGVGHHRAVAHRITTHSPSHAEGPHAQGRHLGRRHQRTEGHEEQERTEHGDSSRVFAGSGAAAV